MLYALLLPLGHHCIGFNVFRYITFRTGLAIATAFFVSLVVAPWLVERLRALQIRQEIREEGPEHHQVKADTPTMGGVLIVGSITLATLLWADLTNLYVWTVLGEMFELGELSGDAHRAAGAQAATCCDLLLAVGGAAARRLADAARATGLIVMSGADQRVLVLRNGVEIGRARINVRDPGKPLGTHAFVMSADVLDVENPLVPGSRMPKWTAIAMPGHLDEAGRDISREAIARVSMPPGFARAVHGLLAPGATLYVTDAPILTEHTHPDFTVLSTGAPETTGM